MLMHDLFAEANLLIVILLFRFQRIGHSSFSREAYEKLLTFVAVDFSTHFCDSIFRQITFNYVVSLRV